jgi:hypothetical protein
MQVCIFTSEFIPERNLLTVGSVLKLLPFEAICSFTRGGFTRDRGRLVAHSVPSRLPILASCADIQEYIPKGHSYFLFFIFSPFSSVFLKVSQQSVQCTSNCQSSFFSVENPSRKKK